MRIGFARDRVGQSGHAAGMERRRPSGKAGDREVEAAPEEMDRARLAEEAAAEELEDAIGLDERAPETMGRGAVVGSVGAVERKADRVGNLVRCFVDRYRDAEPVQEIDDPTMEGGNSLRRERKRPFLATAGASEEAVADEVELDLEDFVPCGNRRRTKPASRDVKWYLPAMVDPGRKPEADLAYDLRPELQGRGRVAPERIGQIRPRSGVVVHGTPPFEGRLSSGPRLAFA